MDLLHIAALALDAYRQDYGDGHIRFARRCEVHFGVLPLTSGPTLSADVSFPLMVLVPLVAS